MELTKSNLEAVIKNCEWPSSCSKVVKTGVWDYEDAEIYFQHLESSTDVLYFVEHEDDSSFGYMAPTLSDEGLLYLLPRLMIGSIEDLDSGLTTGLLNVFCDHSQTEGKFYFSDILNDEQRYCVEMYLRYFLENHPDSHLYYSVLNCVETGGK